MGDASASRAAAHRDAACPGLAAGGVVVAVELHARKLKLIAEASSRLGVADAVRAVRSRILAGVRLVVGFTSRDTVGKSARCAGRPGAVGGRGSLGAESKVFTLNASHSAARCSRRIPIRKDKTVLHHFKRFGRFTRGFMLFVPVSLFS